MEVDHADQPADILADDTPGLTLPPLSPLTLPANSKMHTAMKFCTLFTSFRLLAYRRKTGVKERRKTDGSRNRLFVYKWSNRDKRITGNLWIFSPY